MQFFRKLFGRTKQVDSGIERQNMPISPEPTTGGAEHSCRRPTPRTSINPDLLNAVRERAVPLALQLVRDRDYSGTTALLDSMDKESRDAMVSYMLLVAAMTGCDCPTLEYLLREGADPDCVRDVRLPLGDKDGDSKPGTALHIAAAMDRGDLVDALLVAGASMELRAFNDQTAYQVAVEYQSSHAAAVLLLHGAESDPDGTMKWDELQVHVDDQNAEVVLRQTVSQLRFPRVYYDCNGWNSLLVQFAMAVRDRDDHQELASLAAAAAKEPSNTALFFNLGARMIDYSDLTSVAANLLWRAYTLDHSDSGDDAHKAIVHELVAALERSGNHAAACEVLKREQELLQQDFIARYLLAFNAFMAGNLDAAERAGASLVPADSQQEGMSRRIGLFLKRARTIKDIGRELDNRDLRGWQYAVTGAVLLHRSPAGFDQGMNGRYAMVNDNPALCMEGILRLHAVLDAWDQKPPAVFYLPDTESEILARAAARVLGVDAKPWSLNSADQDEFPGTDEPGLIVAYDLNPDVFDPNTSTKLLTSLLHRQAGQVLWQHACPWQDVRPNSNMVPFCPDIVTYLYEMNVALTDDAMTFPASLIDGRLAPTEQDNEGLSEERSIDDWVSEILSQETMLEHLTMPVKRDGNDDTAGRIGDRVAEGIPDEFDSLAELVEFARSVRPEDSSLSVSMEETGNRRPKMFPVSQVKSSSFSGVNA